MTNNSLEALFAPQGFLLSETRRIHKNEQSN